MNKMLIRNLINYVIDLIKLYSILFVISLFLFFVFSNSSSNHFLNAVLALFFVLFLEIFYTLLKLSLFNRNLIEKLIVSDKLRMFIEFIIALLVLIYLLVIILFSKLFWNLLKTFQINKILIFLILYIRILIPFFLKF